MKVVAAKHGIHRVTVSKVLDRAGAEKRPKGMRPNRVDIATPFYKFGLSLASLEAQLGFDATTIRTKFRRRSITMRDSHRRY